MSWKALNSDGMRAGAMLGLLGVLSSGSWLARPGTVVQYLVEAVVNDDLNDADTDAMVLGYYDAVQRPSSTEAGGVAGLAAAPKPSRGADHEDFLIEESEAVRHIDGFLRYELKPNVDTLYRNVPLQTNRWGQRDQDCEKAKPDGTFRVALVGASFAMGSGAAYEDTFAYLLEERLKQDLANRGSYQHYEVINFGINGYFLFEHLYVIENKVPEFSPDLVLLSLVRADRRLLHTRLAMRLKLRPEIDELHYDFLKDMVERTGIDPADYSDHTRTTRKLLPFRDEMFAIGLAAIAQWSADSGIPVGVLVLHLEPGQEPDGDTLWVADQVEKSGLTALRVFDAYRNADPTGMYLSERDRHPTPMAHKRLADDIYDEIMANRTLRRMFLGKSAG